MRPSTDAKPTSRQLQYLRVLADRTGTTFTYPATRGEAGAQIDRLRKLGPDPCPPRLERPVDPGDSLAYATAVRDDEISGFGSSATWRAGSGPGPSSPAPPKPHGRQRELARYALTSAERILFGERRGDFLRITDRPSSGAGPSYLVERELAPDGEGALAALIADYVQQARNLDEVPMASAAVRELFGRAASNA